MWTPFKKHNNKTNTVYIWHVVVCVTCWHEVFQMKSFGTQFLNRDACLFRVAQKKCFLNQTCNSRQRYEVSQCFIQSLYWCGIYVKYMYHAASNSGGWAGVPIKNFVFAPPSFLVSLPYANTGIRSNNVKHMWNQCELCHSDKDVKHNHMRWCATETNAFAKSFRGVSFRRFSFSHVCALPWGREWVSLLQGLWCFGLHVYVWCFEF